MPQELLHTHPHGVQPWGNYYLATGQHIRGPGLGALAALSDELLLAVLGQLRPQALLRCAAASRALYCFCYHEELWRALTLQEREGDFRFCGTWRHTYLAAAGLGCAPERHQRRQPLRIGNFYSDLLYQPFFCATTPLRPEWLRRDTLDRRAGLCAQDFWRLYEQPNRPVVLTDGAKGWPACKKWTRGYLRKAFKGQNIVAGDYTMAFDDYLAYMDGASADEMPLYLFDCKFAAKAPSLAADYSVPEAFAEDLFAVLGERDRPDYRWLIMGPARSGSSFHKDPNATSAWNAVVRGAKKWILFPPHATPPGVHASADGAEVATPVSLMEWFLNFYEEAHEGGAQPMEGIVRAGEVLFVPRGWWHLAINLEETVAVTHNFVSGCGVRSALAFLATGSAELVSGCPREARGDLHARFLSALRQQRPEVLEATLGPEKGTAAGNLASLFGAMREEEGDERACKRPRLLRDGTGDAVASKPAVAKECAGFRFNFSAAC